MSTREIATALRRMILIACIFVAASTFGAQLLRAGTLTVSSDPPGAEVKLDGRPVGTTKVASMPVSNGIHTLEVAKEGFEVVKKTITITKDPSIQSFSLKKLSFDAYLLTYPTGAQVFLDGTLIGSTTGHGNPRAKSVAEIFNLPVNDFSFDFEVRNVSPGLHQLEVREACWVDVKKTIDGSQLKENPYLDAIVLEPSLAFLTIDADDPQMIVTLDGKEIGHAEDGSFTLCSGSHVIGTFIKDQHIQKEVYLDRYQTLSLTFENKTLKNAEINPNNRNGNLGFCSMLVGDQTKQETLKNNGVDHGLIIECVSTGSPAAQADLKEKEVITAFNDHQIRDKVDEAYFLDSMRTDKDVVLTVMNHKTPVSVTLRAIEDSKIVPCKIFTRDQTTGSLDNAYTGSEIGDYNLDITSAKQCGSNRSKSDLEKRHIPFTREAFFKALKAGDQDIVKLFLDAGMWPNSRTDNGDPAILLVADYQNPAILKLLLRYKASVDARAQNGATALMIAANHDSLEIVKILVGAKADVNVHDDQGMTPLLWAVKNSKPVIVRELVKAGASTTAKNNNGQSAADLAEGDNSLLSLLH